MTTPPPERPEPDATDVVSAARVQVVEPQATFWSGVAGVFGWRPMQMLAGLLVIAVMLPTAQKLLDPFGATAPKGGVSVDTSGAEGTIDSGQFRLELPLAVANRTDNVVVGVSVWTDAWDCPSLFTPKSGCRRLLSTGQDFAMRLAPGGNADLPTVLTGGLPAGAEDGDSVRIERRLENIYDDRDVKRSEAQTGVN